MMHYRPELVNLAEAGSGQSKPFAAQTLNDRVAWIPRNWQKVTSYTSIGNPARTTAEKGRRFAEAVTARYAELFRELVRSDIYQD